MNLLNTECEKINLCDEILFFDNKNKTESFVTV